MKTTAEDLKHILGVVGSKSYNLDTKTEDYTMKLVVDSSVIKWLELHDIEYTKDRRKVYIVNNIKYINLGVDFKNIEWGKE